MVEAEAEVERRREDIVLSIYRQEHAREHDQLREEIGRLRSELTWGLRWVNRGLGVVGGLSAVATALQAWSILRGR